MLDLLGNSVPFPTGGVEDTGRVAVRLVEQAAHTQQMQQQPQPLEEDKQQAEPQKEKTVKQTRNAWLQKTLSDLVDQIEAELLEQLFRWEPLSGTLDKNILQLLHLMEQYCQKLAEQGQPLLMNAELEDALLQALSRLLVQQAGNFLCLAIPTTSQSEVEGLLNSLFMRVVDGKVSHEGLSNAAAMLRRSVTSRSEQPSCQTLGSTASTHRYGVIYQQATTGITLDPTYSRSSKAVDRPPYPVCLPTHGAHPSSSSLSGRAIQIVTQFAWLLQTFEPVPKGAFPFVSEERLGLELGVVSLYGELAAAQPELTPILSAMVRETTSSYVQGYLAQAEKELSRYAVRHPPVDVCPAYRLDAVSQISQYLLYVYKKTQNPEQAVLRTLKYAFARFEEKQKDMPYQSWLRYCMEHSFFALQSDIELDLKRGWEQLCKRWNQFLRTMDFPGTQFRASIWGMVLQPKCNTRSAGLNSLQSVGRWLLVCAGGAIALAGLFPELNGFARAGCLAIGIVLLSVSLLKN